MGTIYGDGKLERGLLAGTVGWLASQQKKKTHSRVQIIVFQFSHIRDSSQEASLFEEDEIRPCCDTWRKKKNVFLRAAEALDRFVEARLWLQVQGYSVGPIGTVITVASVAKCLQYVFIYYNKTMAPTSPLLLSSTFHSTLAKYWTVKSKLVKV